MRITWLCHIITIKVQHINCHTWLPNVSSKIYWMHSILISLTCCPVVTSQATCHIMKDKQLWQFTTYNDYLSPVHHFYYSSSFISFMNSCWFSRTWLLLDSNPQPAYCKKQVSECIYKISKCCWILENEHWNALIKVSMAVPNMNRIHFILYWGM